MRHFGSRPIRFAWSGIVLPSLLLNYAGQSAIVLEGTPTTGNIFYRLCPLLIPFVVLATIATIIASQSIITGAMREVWGWSLLTSATVAGVFLCIDAC